MDDSTRRLAKCFLAVFPSLTEETVAQATQDNVIDWDSVNTINLLNVIQEEFGIEVDYERMEEVTSFAGMQKYVQEQQAP